MARAFIGDKVQAMGITVTIAKIMYQENYGYWDIEFIDTDDNYRHWKQYFDGGRLIRANGERVLINYHGCDCTDIFKKYGMI